MRIRPWVLIAAALVVLAGPVPAASAVTTVGWNGSFLQMRGDAASDEVQVLVDANARTVEFLAPSSGVVEGPDSSECGPTSGGRVLCTFASLPADLTADASMGSGDDEVRGSPGLRFTYLDLGPGADKSFTNEGDDTVVGGPDGDRIEAGAGKDDLIGGPGADTLKGQSGDDSYEGGIDADVFDETGNGGEDTIFYGEASAGVSVSLDGIANDGNVVDDGAGDTLLGPIENVFGSSFNDALTGNGDHNQLRGGAGNDRLDGGGASDTLVGGPGDDDLRARDDVRDDLLDCDDGAGEDTAGGDIAAIDAVDPEPLRCATVERAASTVPGGGGGGGGGTGGGSGSTGSGSAGAGTPTGPPTSPPGGRPRVVVRPSLEGDVRVGGRVTCSIGGFAGGVSAFDPPVFFTGFGPTATVLGRGASLVLPPQASGEYVGCVVTARNAAGATTVTSIERLVPAVRIMPRLSGSLQDAKNKLLTLAGGGVSFGTDKAQLKLGKSVDDIPCASRGRKAPCTRAQERFRGRIKPGTVFKTVPAAGQPLPDGTTVKLSYYEPAKDEKLPAPTPRRFGDDCPLTGDRFDADQRQAFVDSLVGKYRGYALELAAKRECLAEEKVSYRLGQDVDSYVREAQTFKEGGVRKVRLLVDAPKLNDLILSPFHYQLGRDDNLGFTDGFELTVAPKERHDLCFVVTEASTGREVAGVEVTVNEPQGAPLAYSFQKLEFLPTGKAGITCARLPIREAGDYAFTATYRGANGVNAEGIRIVRAAKRGDGVRTLNGTVFDKKGDVYRARPGSPARAQASQGGPFDAIAGFLSRVVGFFRGPGSVPSGSPEVRLRAAQKKNVSATTITAAPRIVAPVVAGAIGTTPSVVSTGGGGLVGQDGGTLRVDGAATLAGLTKLGLVGQDGGSLVGQDGGTLIGLDGGTLIGNDGSTLVAAGGGNLIGNDGSTLVAAGGGNVLQIEGRAVIADRGGAIAPGIQVAGAGLMPVSRSGG